MMSLPWARVMVWRRIGTAMVAIWEWLASSSLHMSGLMWLYCSAGQRGRKGLSDQLLVVLLVLLGGVGHVFLKTLMNCYPSSQCRINSMKPL